MDRTLCAGRRRLAADRCLSKLKRFRFGLTRPADRDYVHATPKGVLRVFCVYRGRRIGRADPASGMKRFIRRGAPRW